MGRENLGAWLIKSRVKALALLLTPEAVLFKSWALLFKSRTLLFKAWALLLNSRGLGLRVRVAQGVGVIWAAFERVAAPDRYLQLEV